MAQLSREPRDQISASFRFLPVFRLGQLASLRREINICCPTFAVSSARVVLRKGATTSNACALTNGNILPR